MIKKIKGMTWDHPRGYAPLEEAAKRYQQLHPDVEITWDRRSLQAFADRPIDLMAAEYDLMIIDHPHVGEITRKQCLVELDTVGRDSELEQLKRNSLGPSHASYFYDDHQWALALDAAAQIACSRPDLMDSPVPTNWNQVIELAKKGTVLCPLKPVDAIDSFFTLCANLGDPVAQSQQELVKLETAQTCLEIMKALADNVPKFCLEYNPIQVFELMSQQNDFVYCPLLFGYTNYGRPNYRDHLIEFHDIPSFSPSHVKGSIIGGTGICVSSKSEFVEQAIDFSFWLASEDVQKGFYFESGGQPAHKAAWLDSRINKQCNNFMTSTIQTLEQAWIRPRYDGYMGLADDGGDVVNGFLRGKVSMEKCIKQLEYLYQYSLTHPASQKFE
ncbi:extracellular solute-binding protein [Thaumasiovibrio sp. DFM-14]|uniref:extracellular solute-binding protein n=1 Tax=Thaumasiovibrio sp. DFM-14 TaxID=3384792 RepID=UPI0039A32C00